MSIVVITDDSTREAQEAYVRRLMHRRAQLPITWETRTKRAELLAEINTELEKFNAYGSDATSLDAIESGQ